MMNSSASVSAVLRVLEVDAAHPVALLLEVGDEVVADEAAGAGDENACGVGIGHGSSVRQFQTAILSVASMDAGRSDSIPAPSRAA